MIKVLIVDDERKACTNLENILTTYVADEDIHVAGFAHNTAEAEEQIRLLAPDAVFLDIEMPNENAFRFLERISPFNFEVVFVTSYDEYAVKAFKLNAVDYILNPISVSELKGAVRRLKEKIKFRDLVAANSDFYREIASGKTQHKITLKDTGSTEVVDFKDIYFVEAQSSYSRILFSKNNTVKEIVMSNPLSEYEELLPSSLFYRIHRSYLVNCSYIKTILREDLNKVVINDFVLPVSRRRYTSLLEFLKANAYALG